MTSKRNTHWLLPWNCSFDSTFPDRETILSVLMFAEGQSSRVSNSQVCMMDGFCFAIIKVQRWYSRPVPLSKVPEFSVMMTEFEYDFQSRYSFIVPCCRVSCWAEAEYTQMAYMLSHSRSTDHKGLGVGHWPKDVTTEQVDRIVSI